VPVGGAAITVPREGDLASWLAHAGATNGAGASGDAQSAWVDRDTAPAEDGAAVIWRATEAGATARFSLSRIDRANMERIAQLFHATLASVIAPGARLESVAVLAAAERTLVVETWNQTRVEYRPEATVHALFREQAAAHPERVAIAWDGGALSYGELDRWSDALAERLIAAGVAADQPVALVMERCPEAIVAALAILKAGGAYLPLDPEYPADRLSFAIGDAGAGVLITTHARGNALAAFAPRTLFVEDARGDSASVLPRVERATPHTRAYVMYTSSSTGTPKGVQIEHRSIIRLVGRPAYVELGEHTRFLHAAPLGFDASTLELWGPLLHGGSVVIYRDPVPTGRGLARAIAAHGVTTMWLTAALFNSVVDEDPRLLAGLRQLFTGGEALSPTHVHKALAALPQTELVNGYGPTECTTFTTTFSIPRDFPPDTALPIGAPIADTQCYVLDQAGQPVPVGIVGELFVGGLGVARGYLARPELDRERFVANPFGDGRLYRTGDRVRWRADGTIDFLGRADNQVKLRGFRIELGEIEAVLTRHEGVRQAVAVIREDDPGDPRLVAYVTAVPGASVSAAELRECAAQTLPQYMVPSACVLLDAF
ncbi:MAG TPA: amino acid adenylation domain-containing protein, partial [Kofleriaceae bacterium]